MQGRVSAQCSEINKSYQRQSFVQSKVAAHLTLKMVHGLVPECRSGLPYNNPPGSLAADLNIYPSGYSIGYPIGYVWIFCWIGLVNQMYMLGYFIGYIMDILGYAWICT
jgi:hypothetical protein